jgi:hypothetical protein
MLIHPMLTWHYAIMRYHNMFLSTRFDMNTDTTAELKHKLLYTTSLSQTTVVRKKHYFKQNLSCIVPLTLSRAILFDVT